MINSSYELNGYVFETLEDYNKAKSELSAVMYIKSQVKNKSIEQRYDLYCSIIKQNSFTTVIGFKYLTEFRNSLSASEQLSGSYIPPIPIKHTMTGEKKKKRILPFLVTIAATAIITTICVVLLLNNSKNLNVVNYKRVLNAEYSVKMERLNNMINEAETPK